MYRPRKIKIGTTHYSVTWYKEQDHKDSTHVKGQTNHAELTIIIYTSGVESDIMNTLLHECLHAVYYERFMGADMNEELCVNGMTHGLLQLFQDNPKLLDYIKETL